MNGQPISLIDPFGLSFISLIKKINRVSGTISTAATVVTVTSGAVALTGVGAPAVAVTGIAGTIATASGIINLATAGIVAYAEPSRDNKVNLALSAVSIIPGAKTARIAKYAGVSKTTRVFSDGVTNLPGSVVSQIYTQGNQQSNVNVMK